MHRIVQLLQEKNQHLEAFHQLNSEEMEGFIQGNFANLERFYSSREALLEMIRIVDSQIDDAQAQMEDHAQIEDQTKAIVLKAFNEKNDLVQKILAQDLQILSVIERAKSEIIRELSKVRSSKKAVGAYHSGNSTKGIDEEI